MSKALFGAALAAMLLALAAGCAPIERDEFLALQSRVMRNQNQISQMQARLDQLEKQFEVSRQPTAELVSQTESLRQDLMRLNGRLDELEHGMGSAGGAASAQLDQRLARLEEHLGMPKDGSPAPKPQAAQPQASAKPAPPPDSPKALYNLGLQLFKEKKYEASRERFQEFLERYPKDSLAGHAQFWLGETFYSQKRYEEAILAYNQVIKRHAKSSKVPSALLKQGLAFQNLGDKRAARIVLENLVKNHPKTRQARAAKDYLKKLK